MLTATFQYRAGEFGEPFDASILVKRYGAPLFAQYMSGAIRRDDVGRLRFALSQGHEVTDNCFLALFQSTDAALLNGVLLASKVLSGSIPKADHELIEGVLSRNLCNADAKKVLADVSSVV